MSAIKTTSAVITETENGYNVYGGEDLLKSCPTIKEAKFIKKTYEECQIEFMQTLLKTFYKHRSISGIRMCIMHEARGETFVDGENYYCKLIFPFGIKYSILSKEFIAHNYKEITFTR